MADIYGYMYADVADGVSTRKIKLRSQDGSVMCGCRFKYIAEEVSADYNSLVQALNEAIDAVVKEKGASAVTDKKNEFKIEELDFDIIKEKFEQIVKKIISSHTEKEMEEI